MVTPSGTGRPARLKVGIVGCGRVGAVLGAALVEAGHKVVAFSGMSDESRTRGKRFLPGVPIMTPEDVTERADLVLMAPPSRHLENVIHHLHSCGAFHAGHIVVHTDARHGVGMFAGIPHILPIALHPAMRFTGSSGDLSRLRLSSVAVTTVEERRAVGEALVVEMGAEPVWVPESVRPTYGAVSALLGDHLHAAIEVGMERFSGVDTEGISRLLVGYVHSTVEIDGVRSAHPHGAAALGDAGALSRDLEVLRGGAVDLRLLYRAGARLAVAQALRRGEVIDLADDAVFDALAGRDDGPEL